MKNAIFNNLSALFKLLPANIYWLNKDNIYQGCNYQQADFFGLNSPEEIIGKTNQDIELYKKYPLVGEMLNEVNKEIMREGKPKILEEPLLLDDGTELVFFTQKIPLLDEEGEVIGLLGISSDISEINQARKKLVQEKERIVNTLQQIIAHAPGHVYWKDRSGVYLGCNDLQAVNFGLKKGSEVVGKTDFDLFANKVIAQGFRENDMLVMDTGESVTAEEVARINDRPAIMLSHKVPLKNESGEISGIIGISLDITELKNTQDKLKRAEERLQGMTTLSSTIAHELRTPLTAIENGVSGIKDYLPILIDGYTKAKQHNLPVEFIRPHHYEILMTVLDDVESETHYANTIINMILMNVKQNKIPSSSFQTVAIGACIDEALRRYPFKTKEAEQINWDHENNFLFRGNKVLMVHTLFNLLKNALYFIEAESKGAVFIRCEATDNCNILYFKDTAKGIPSNEVSKLFEKFYTTTINGTGLGLAFCKMVMESFGGDISCKSEYGQFVEFILKFPKIIDGEKKK